MGNKASKDKQKLKPSAMDDLLQSTMFTEEEIKSWYKNFLKEFPDGQVTKEQFKELYSKQFPSGDAKEFAEHVFRTFDKDSDHTLDFREFMTALSTTARGGPKERLKWAFHMYDIDQNGYISKDECTEIIKALYKLLGKHLPKKAIDKSPEKRADNIFSLLDLNQDNCITSSYPCWIKSPHVAIYVMHTERQMGTQIKSPESVTDMIFQTMDKNKDGKLSLDEFVEGAKTDTTLINLLSSK